MTDGESTEGAQPRSIERLTPEERAVFLKALAAAALRRALEDFARESAADKDGEQVANDA